MAFFRQKESALDRRLRELDKELGHLKDSRKAAERNAAAARGAPAAIAAQEAPTSPADSRIEQPPAPEAQESEEQEKTFFSHLAKSNTAPAEQDDLEPNLFNFAPTQDERASRHRFASYFMAGHFNDLQPRRQERRVQRNKAIVTLIVTLLVLAWVVYWIFFADIIPI